MIHWKDDVTQEQYVEMAREAAKAARCEQHLEQSFMVSWLARLLVNRDAQVAEWRRLWKDELTREKVQGEIYRGEHDPEGNDEA